MNSLNSLYDGGEMFLNAFKVKLFIIKPARNQNINQNKSFEILQKIAEVVKFGTKQKL